MFLNMFSKLVALSLFVLFTNASDSFDQKYTNIENKESETELTDLHQSSDTLFHCETGSVVTPDQIEDWLNYIKLNQFRSNYIKSNELQTDYKNEEIIFEDAEVGENDCNIGKQFF